MYIYVISNPAFDGWLKVGKTKNLHTRLNAYNTCSPFDYDYVLVDEYPDDRPIHNRLLAMGIERQREWFKCELDVIEEAIADVIAREIDSKPRADVAGEKQDSSSTLSSVEHCVEHTNDVANRQVAYLKCDNAAES